MPTRLLLLLTAVLATLQVVPATAARAEESDLQTFGDIMQIFMPAVAGVSTFFTNPEEGRTWDREGTKQFVFAFGSSWTTTYVLKVLAGKMRPNGDNRTSFPSGHTIIALLVLWQAARHRVRGWPFLVPIVAGLICGTVYLRYHYGVDVLAGIIIAAAIALMASTARA